MELTGSAALERICKILSTGYFVCFITYTPFLDYIRNFVVPKNGEQVSMYYWTRVLELLD